MFEEVEGKIGHRWYWWVMQSASVVYDHMAPGRGADVEWGCETLPEAHFAGLRKDLVEVVLICDRYSAYKCLAKDHDDLMLAFCWVHVRRDFLEAARSWPEFESWMFVWIEDIRELYRLNAARLEVWDETLPLVPEVVDAVQPIPVVAAGGIADGRGLAAVLLLGASGVLMGTRFYVSAESLALHAAKAHATETSGDHTTRSAVFDALRQLDWPKPFNLRTLTNAITRR